MRLEKNSGNRRHDRIYLLIFIVILIVSSFGCAGVNPAAGGP